MSLKKISSKTELNIVLDNLRNLSDTSLPQVSEVFWNMLAKDLLQHKVKFPILEHLAVELDKLLSPTQIDDLLIKLSAAKYISSYPVIGKLIQLRQKNDLIHTFDQAISHIIEGDEWYACDIISERVFGEGLLLDFNTAYQKLEKMGDHENMWIQRSIGIATHYAVKKKLPKHQVEKLFFLMLLHGRKTRLYIKKGIGWPAKTIGKFHPDLIYKHEKLIKSTKLSKWFKNKINIGLSMAKQKPLVYE